MSYATAIKARTPLIIHENVPRFMINVLMDMLGADWGVYSLENCRPSDIGYWATSRTRRYDIIYLKQALRPVGDPVEL